MKNATHNDESSANNNDTSASTQRLQIVALINRYQSRNTPEFRQEGIMAPAPRIFELRQQGYPIEKILEDYTDETGKVHHGVARYYFTNNPPANDNITEKAAGGLSNHSQNDLYNCLSIFTDLSEEMLRSHKAISEGVTGLSIINECVNGN